MICLVNIVTTLPELRLSKSMTAYGATAQGTADANEAAGYRSGGRVGLEWGGMPSAIQAVEEKETKWITQKRQNGIQSNEI